MTKSNAIIVIALMLAPALPLVAQDAEPAMLFRETTPLPVQLTVSLRELKKSSNDTVYFPATLRYQHSGTWDSVQVDVRARGNFRRKNCSFPPLRIRIKKKEAKGSMFAGARHLKLVVPCQVARNYGTLIAKELVAYKLYETITPYAFKTRLLAITLTDDDKKSKSFVLTGFFIEDDDDLADRLGAEVFEQERILPTILEDTASLRFDLFQYMIGNTDFSTTFLHNAKLVKTSTGRIIPIGFDFDMAGLINAPYATFDESLGIRSVTERAYKGYCRNESVAQFVRQQFLDTETQLVNIVDENAGLFEERDLAGMKKYLASFFELIRKDDYYKRNVAEKCRTQ
jgi:hypothetical protein